MKNKPTKQTAIKILDLLKHGLVRGLGNPEPGKMCVEAAVCYAMGLPHSDNPPCVAAAVRSFKITLNDSNWSSDTARAVGLQRIAIAQLGSENIDQSLFVKELTRLTIKKILPLALRAAAKAHPQISHKEALEKAAYNCKSIPTENAAAAYAARAAAAADAYAAAAAAAAYASAAYAAAADAARADEILTIAAEIGVEALKLCKSPGCKWLNLIK